MRQTKAKGAETGGAIGEAREEGARVYRRHTRERCPPEEQWGTSDGGAAAACSCSNRGNRRRAASVWLEHAVQLCGIPGLKAPPLLLRQRSRHVGLPLLQAAAGAWAGGGGG